MMYLGDKAIGINTKLNSDYLLSHTFVDALGEADRWTIPPHPEWINYDCLLMITDLIITSHDEQTKGNWLWYSISDEINTNYNYNGDGAVSVRNHKYAILVIHDDSENKWYIQPLTGGRPAVITSSAKLSELTLKIGTLYSGSYGLLNGTIDIYGISFHKEVTPNG